MNNTLKKLADLVRQEKDATAAFNVYQQKALERERKDNEKLMELRTRIDDIAAAKDAMLDDLADDDFEAVTVE